MTVPVALTLAQAKDNLDLFAASQGHCIAQCLMTVSPPANGEATDPEKAIVKAANSTENLVTKALGVLQGQGIYAMFLLLVAREKAPGEELKKQLISMIDAMQVADPLLPQADVFQALKGSPVLTNLSTLLLVKRTMERVLTYARYHAKAQGSAANGH